MLPDAVRVLFKALRLDNRRGASSLFHDTLPAFPLLADLIDSQPGITHKLLSKLAKEVRSIQPCMAPFHQLAEYVLQLRSDDLRPAVVSSAFRALPYAMQRVFRKDAQRITEEALKACSNCRSLMTHSHSGVVHQFLAVWLAQDAQREIWISESRPVGEGLTLAGTLADLPNRRVVLADDARNLGLPHVDAVIVGADRISERQFVNKIGTYSLATLARAQNKPVFVLADSLKLLPESVSLPEEKGHSAGDFGAAHAGAEVFNYYFEPVPAQLASGFITPVGRLEAGDLPGLFKGEAWSCLLRSVIEPGSAG